MKIFCIGNNRELMSWLFYDFENVFLLCQLYIFIYNWWKRHPHTYYIQLWSKVSSLACHGNLGLLKIYLTSSLFQGVIIVQHILTSLKTEMGAHVWIPFGFSLIYIRLNALLKKIKGTLSKHITSQRGKNMLDIHYWYGLDNVLPFFDQIKMFNLQWDRIQRHPENQTEKNGYDNTL